MSSEEASSDDDAGWADERAVLPVEVLFAAAEGLLDASGKTRWAARRKGNKAENLSVFCEDVKLPKSGEDRQSGAEDFDPDRLLAETVVDEIMETLGETDIDAQIKEAEAQAFDVEVPDLLNSKNDSHFLDDEQTMEAAVEQQLGNDKWVLVPSTSEMMTEAEAQAAEVEAPHFLDSEFNADNESHFDKQQPAPVEQQLNEFTSVWVPLPSTSATNPNCRSISQDFDACLDENYPDHHPDTDLSDSDTGDLVTVREIASLPVGVSDKQATTAVTVRVRGQRKLYSRAENKLKREKGEEYLGYRRTDKKKTNVIAHDAPRHSKAMGPPCNSVKCQKWSTRFCDSISETNRAEIFSKFWKQMNWDTKKMFVCSLVDIKKIAAISTQQNEEAQNSRRGLTFLYHLKVGENKLQVCKKMFLSTLGVGEMSVRNWLQNYHVSSIPSKKKSAQIQEQPNAETLTDDSSSEEQNNPPQRRLSFERSEAYLRQFFNLMPKLPSHYIRKDSRKLYLEADIGSVSELYRLYQQKCAEDSEKHVSRFTFDKVYKSMGIGIFNPRKDQCDVCCGFKTGNVSQEVHERHMTSKTQARNEKDSDKKRAIAGEIHVITCDMMAVQLMPRLMASSSYYKLKLHVHNYSVFNLVNHDVKCYWWDESVGSLDATVYASCLVDYIDELMLSSPKKDVVIYTDGCTAQNRNNVLSNALLHTSMKHKIRITQKILEKGHTQMEVDSVHSHIERKMGKSELYLPHGYIQKTVEARVEQPPYRAVYLDHGFFFNYGVEEKMIYPSIRPGTTKGDPVVLDIRWIQYEPHCEIKFKLKFDEEPRTLPRRPNTTRARDHSFPKLYTKGPRPLPLDKYTDLVFLAENLLPNDCLDFYKGLPHQEHSIRKERKNAKKEAVKEAEENQPKKKKKSK